MLLNSSEDRPRVCDFVSSELVADNVLRKSEAFKSAGITQPPSRAP